MIVSNDIFKGSKKLPEEAINYIKNSIKLNESLDTKAYIYFPNNFGKAIKIE